MIFASRFSGKVMVVTGAAQGIGLAIATRAAHEGAQLTLVDRAAFLPEIAADLAQVTPVHAVAADLETYAGATLAMAQTIQRFGRIDILMNVVGGTIWMKPFARYDEQEIEAEIRRSLFPTLWCCRAALPYMAERGAGTVVNVSSVATRGIHRVPYAAAKGGVNAMTECLAMEYASRGIRVVGTAPGGTDAPARRVPRNVNRPTEEEAAWGRQVREQTVESSLLKRYGTLEEQAAVALFLASDEASYMTGTVTPVAGGDKG